MVYAMSHRPNDEHKRSRSQHWHSRPSQQDCFRGFSATTLKNLHLPSPYFMDASKVWVTLIAKNSVCWRWPQL